MCKWKKLTFLSQINSRKRAARCPPRGGRRARSPPPSPPPYPGPAQPSAVRRGPGLAPPGAAPPLRGRRGSGWGRPLRGGAFLIRPAAGGSIADMAAPDPRYPRASIEDDFNYGSSVASASVHIRMGRSPLPRSPRPVLPRSQRRRRASGFRGRAPPAGPRRAAWSRGFGGRALPSALRSGLRGRAPPALGRPGGRRAGRRSRASQLCAQETKMEPVLLEPCRLRCRKGQMKTSAALIWPL